MDDINKTKDHAKRLKIEIKRSLKVQNALEAQEAAKKENENPKASPAKAIALGVTLAAKILSPNIANAETFQSDDKPKEGKELIIQNNPETELSNDTIFYNAHISREHHSPIYDSIVNANLVLSDGKIVVNDYSALDKLGIDIDDYNLQIPDNLLGSDVLNKITPSKLTNKLNSYARRTKGHKGLCTGDIKVMIERVCGKNIKDSKAWGRIVWCDEFYDFVKAGKLRGFVAFTPNQEIKNNNAEFCCITMWTGKEPGTQTRHTGFHPSTIKRINEEYINFMPYGSVNPKKYKDLLICVANRDIAPVLKIDGYVSILDKENQTIVLKEITAELKNEIEGIIAAKVEVEKIKHLYGNLALNNNENNQNTKVGLKDIDSNLDTAAAKNPYPHSIHSATGPRKQKTKNYDQNTERLILSRLREREARRRRV